MEQNYFDNTKDEIVISFRKIWDNVKRYWWICFITVAMSGAFIIILMLKEHQDVVNLKNSDTISKQHRKYQAVTMVYMEPKESMLSPSLSGEIGRGEYDQIFRSYVDSYTEFVKAYIDEWYWEENYTILNDCMALLGSDRVLKQVDEGLRNEGMEPFDQAMDQLVLEIQEESNCYTITARGTDAKRVELIANGATQALLKEAVDILEIQDGKIIDLAVVNLYEETKDEEEPYVIITENSIVEKAIKEGAANLSLSSFFLKKNILILGIGLFIGIGVIFIFVLKDKKIRVKEDMTAHFSIPYLGEWESKKRRIADMQCEVLSTALIEKCKREKINVMMLVTPTSFTKTGELAERLNHVARTGIGQVISMEIDQKTLDIEKRIDEAKMNNQFVILCGAGVLSCPNSVKAAGLVDGITMLVTSNQDEIPDLDMALNHISLVNGKLMGYLLIH